MSPARLAKVQAATRTAMLCPDGRTGVAMACLAVRLADVLRGARRCRDLYRAERAARLEAEQHSTAAEAHSRETDATLAAMTEDRNDWRRIAAKRAAANEQLRHGLARALPRAADALEAEAKAVPLVAAFHGGGLDDTPKFDVMMWAVRWMRARDQSHDDDKGGATK